MDVFEAVRLILGVDKNSIKDMYSLLKKKYNPQNKPVSTTSRN